MNILLILKIGSQGWMRHRERIYTARRKRVRDVCDEYNNPQYWKKGRGKKFSLDLKHGLAACLHAKVKLTDIITQTAYKVNSYKDWLYACVYNGYLAF